MNREQHTKRAERSSDQVPTQLEVLRQILFLAAQYDSWMTLEELARKTHFPEASISAQLRHLRKEEHGKFNVQKRRRTWQEALRTNMHEKVWEYAVKAEAERTTEEKASTGNKASNGGSHGCEGGVCI